MKLFRYFLSISLMLQIFFASAQTQEFQDKYPNGNVRSEGIYERGFEDGLWKYYYEDGTLQEEANYKMGKFHGSVFRYHPNGKLMVEGYFKNDKQDSIQRTFTADSILVEQGLWAKGVKTGEWDYFYASGDTMMIENHLDSVVMMLEYFTSSGEHTLKKGNGTVADHFENGRLKSITNYKNGLPDGKFEEYFSGGSVRISGNYIQGKKDGEWVDLFPTGKTKKSPLIVKVF
ncbi:MAG: hypothetical protein R2809_02645 [Flavobacteriales bacterium]